MKNEMLLKKLSMKEMQAVWPVLWNLLLIFAGSVICALAIKGILVPKQFLAGGITGLALLIHYVLPTLPVGLIYFLLNIPLFVVGWLFVGRRFFLYSHFSFERTTAHHQVIGTITGMFVPESPFHPAVVHQKGAGHLKAVAFLPADGVSFEDAGPEAAQPGTPAE